MPFIHRRSLAAVALRERADAVSAVERAEVALARIDCAIEDLRRRAEALSTVEAVGLGTRPAGLVESAALARVSWRRELDETRSGLRRLAYDRERAARDLDAAMELLAHAVHRAELFDAR